MMDMNGCSLHVLIVCVDAGGTDARNVCVPMSFYVIFGVRVSSVADAKCTLLLLRVRLDSLPLRILLRHPMRTD